MLSRPFNHYLHILTSTPWLIVIVVSSFRREVFSDGTDASGRFEIVVQPFPAPTGKWQVSTGGGTQPRWRADGKELYFIAPEQLRWTPILRWTSTAHSSWTSPLDVKTVNSPSAV